MRIVVKIYILDPYFNTVYFLIKNSIITLFISNLFFFFNHQLARLYGGSGVVAQKATAMLDLYDYYIVPVHNPDGYDYAFWVVRNIVVITMLYK